MSTNEKSVFGQIKYISEIALNFNSKGYTILDDRANCINTCGETNQDVSSLMQNVARAVRCKEPHRKRRDISTKYVRQIMKRRPRWTRYPSPQFEGKGQGWGVDHDFNPEATVSQNSAHLFSLGDK